MWSTFSHLYLPHYQYIVILFVMLHTLHLYILFSVSIVCIAREEETKQQYSIKGQM
jgi:hypothetical protein